MQASPKTTKEDEGKEEKEAETNENKPTDNPDENIENAEDAVDEIAEETVNDGVDLAAQNQKPIYPKRVLDRSEISAHLGHLGKTADGYGYAFLKAKLRGMNLTELRAITSFKYLQYLDVSNNTLNLEALQVITELPFLILIQADKNVLESAALNRMKYLQVIIMNKNFINSLEDIYQPELSTLELADNKINTLYFKEQMTNLQVLDLRQNLIQEIREIDFVKLDSLYLAENMIRQLDGIERLINLRILHVRNNPIKQLTGFTSNLKKLEYINLRKCKVSSLFQLKKLRVLPALRTLVLKGCPFMGGSQEEDQEDEEEDDPEIRTQLLAALPKLNRLNKTEVTLEERLAANELLMSWIEDGDKDEEEGEEEMQPEGEENED